MATRRKLAPEIVRTIGQRVGDYYTYSIIGWATGTYFHHYKGTRYRAPKQFMGGTYWGGCHDYTTYPNGVLAESHVTFDGTYWHGGINKANDDAGCFWH